MDNTKKENKLLKFTKSVLSNKVGKLISLIVVVALLVLVYVLLFSNKTAKVDTSYMIAKLENASELTTAKLNYTGYSEYEDEGTTIINKGDFKMVYSATARAGIDVKEIKIGKPDAINKTITIKLPKAKILDVKVDASSIKYFDSKLAIFNFNDKEDAANAISLAETEAVKELEDMGILEMADAQSESLIRGLLEDVKPKEYELKFVTA